MVFVSHSRQYIHFLPEQSPNDEKCKKNNFSNYYEPQQPHTVSERFRILLQVVHTKRNICYIRVRIIQNTSLNLVLRRIPRYFYREMELQECGTHGSEHTTPSPVLCVCISVLSRFLAKFYRF